MSSTLLHISDLHFAHGEQPVVNGVDLVLNDGEVLIVVGPSGCGKSTLLRLIAGLERPDRGSIVLDGGILCDDATFIAPEQRPVGLVFQGLALFPHLTVAGNVGFGLYRLPAAERSNRVDEELRSVGLDGYQQRFPHQLSGGQQQRVAIARSLVLRPRLLLMDEPFSDLDGGTRQQVRTEVLRILRAHGTAAIIVSHDREDAYHLGDRIATMEHGRIQRIEPADVLRSEWTAHPFSP